MRHSMKKVFRIANKFIAMVLMLLISMTCVLSVFGTESMKASAAEVDSTPVLADISAVYFDTANNSGWDPTTGLELYALYGNDSGAVLGKKLFTGSTSFYQADVVSGATQLELILAKTGTVLPDTMTVNGSRRVYFKNNANWSTPHVFAWASGQGNNKAWPGEAMEQVAGTDYWYYDVNEKFTNVIFDDGTGGNVLGVNKTSDLTLQSVDSKIFEWNLSDTKSTQWNSTPYVEKASTVDISSRTAGANEIYALSSGKCVLSKYAYPYRNNVTYKKVYLYNQNWENAYVKYDKSDPFNFTVIMDKQTDSYGTYFEAEVPENSTFIFKPNPSDDLAASNETKIPNGFTQACYKMSNGSQSWCELSEAQDNSYDYSVGSTFGSGILGVNATYYDYLSDVELTNGWLSPIQAGTGFNGAQDNWYPYKEFNKKINTLASANSTNWKFPLYFGNFFDSGDHNGNYTDESKNLTNFFYEVNNSNGLTDYNYALSGLAYDKLGAKNSLQAADGLKMPYFDYDWLKANNAAKTIKAQFPFEENTSGGVTTYSFDSNNAKDNVYFKWNGTTPQSVNYGAGTTYGIQDGLKYFMNGTASGYGIFPFNNTSATKGNRGGNDNLDYGFGIKMEMDFRVPTGGVNADGTPVKFNYSGDDDLWVYLVDKDGNSECVLDLGGDHKQSSGSINFKDMTTTSEKTSHMTTASYDSDKVYITDSYGWGSDNMYVYAWSGSSNDWFKCSYDSATGKSYVSKTDVGYNGTTLSSYSGFLVSKAKGDFSTKTGDGVLSDHYGKNTYTNNISYTDGGPKYVSDGSVTKQINGGVQLDSKDTYKLVVCYMERGMLESNLKMSFTMSPASNNLTVDKDVVTDGVNSALVDDVKNNQNFNFNVTDNGTVSSNKTYSVDGEGAYVTDSNGSFSLKDSQEADFDNQFTTNSPITVTETDNDKGVQYSTNWTLVDNETGKKLDESSETKKASFDLVNPTYSNDYANLGLTYVNTPKVSDITLEKDVVDETGTPIDSTDTFGFITKLDLNGGTDYKAYPLAYHIDRADGTQGDYTATSAGLITFTKGDKITLKGVPVGATYSVSEETAVGYKPYQVKINGQTPVSFDGTVTGTVQENITASYVFINQLHPTSGSVNFKKTLNDADYTGEKFSFTLTGLPSMEYVDGADTKNTMDLSGKTPMTTSKSVSGNVSFTSQGDDMLKFSQTGVYRYKFVENVLDDTDYVIDKAIYLAEIRVTSDTSGNLVVASATYYRTDNNAETTDYQKFFSDDYKIDNVTFQNKVQTGTLHILKVDEKQQGLQGVKFGIYRGYDEATGTLSDPLQKDGVDVTTVTDINGKADITDIPIFAADSTEASPKYQKYYLAEIEGASGYMVLAKPVEFTLPMSYSAGAVVNGVTQENAGKTYEVTYTVQNDKIVMPETDGLGINLIFIIGGIVCMAGFGGFMFVKAKKRRKKQGTL